MNNRLMKVGAVLALLGTPALAEEAQALGVPQCVDDAASAFAECVMDHAWYVAPLCATRYAADVAGCAIPLPF